MASLFGTREKKHRRTCPFCPASISGLLNALKGKLNISAPTRDDPLLLQAENMNSQPQKSAIPMPMNLDLPDKKPKSLCDHIDGEVKIVWPWMGILMNINYEQIARKYSYVKAIDNPPWNVYLKSYFAYLNPRGVQAFRTQGIAVLDFGHDLLGYFDAQNFEKGFAQCRRGKADFESRIKHQKEQVQELFGWIADKNDYNQMNSVGEYLRERGAFRAKPRFCEAWAEQHDILLQDVPFKLQEKNMKLMVLGTEVCSLQTSVYQEENKKYAAEGQFLVMKSKHKKELDAMNERMNEATKSLNDELVKEKENNNFLQAELRKSQEKCQCEHLKENNAQDTSDETLIPKLIDLVEEKEVLQDTLEKLIYKERDISDKFQSAMEAAKEEQIDTNDEKLAKLNEEFGVEVRKTVVDALNELREFNASGKYSISVPWNFDKGRAARLDEIIKYLASDSSKKRKYSF